MAGKDILIDSEKCDGCGLCVEACHEGALALVDGKAVLVRKDFCDGLGDCLPACPRGAISLGEVSCIPVNGMVSIGNGPLGSSGPQWPIQLALVPGRSGLFKGDIVFAADCTAFTANDFRNGILKGRPVIIGCPKLDDRRTFDKVLMILRDNPVDSVEVVRMEVPCCSALSRIVADATGGCGRDVPVRETVVSRDGRVLQSSHPR